MFASLFLKRTIPIKFTQRNLICHVIPQFLSSSKHFVKMRYCSMATKNNIHQEISSFLLRNVYSNAYDSEEGIRVNEANELINHLEMELKNYQRVKSNDAQMLLHFIKKGLIADNEKYALLLLEWCGQSMPDKDASARILFAHTVWQVLRSLGIEVGTKHYNALLKCYTANNHKVSVLQFLADMGKVQPDHITYELLLECCCIVGDLQQATEIIQLMKDNNIPISETSFNLLILGHARAGDIKGSLFILDSMYAANLLPSSNTYTALLLSYAEFGDTVQMKKIYEEAVSKNINLSLAQIISICRILGLKGYQKCIAEFLEMMPNDVKKFTPSVQNTLLEFLHSKNEKAALLLMMTLLSKKDEESESVYAFFVSEMCRANIETNSIINICCYFEKNELYPRALYKAAETSLNLVKPELAMQVFVTLHENNEILRPHYFWPLIRHRTLTNGETGIVSTLKDMQALGVTPDFDTLLDYIVPVISAGNPEQTIEKLKACGISVRQSLTPVAATLLLNGRFESLLRLCEKYPARIDVEKLLQPLVEMFLGGKNANSVMTVLNIISKHTSTDDLPGQFLLQLLTAKQTRFRQKDIVHLLQSFKERGLFISSFTSDILDQFFKNGESNYYQENISLLEAVTRPDLHSASMETIAHITHPRNMNIEELECHLVELKSNGMNTRGILRRLLQIHVQEGNVKRVLEIRKELEDGGFKFSPGMQASLFAMYIQTKDVQQAEKCISELMHQAPDFVIDEHKIIDYATLLVTENQYKAAVTILERRTASGKISGGERISRNCWELLNALAMKGEPQKVKHMLHLLKTLGFCSINNILLGPLIRAHLIRGELEGAVKEYKTCAAESKKTPLQLELLTQIVRKIDDSPSNRKLLEEVLSVSASIHGKSSTGVHYIIALAECNKKKELEKYIVENQRNIQYGNLINAAKRLANENKLSTLSILADVYKALPGFNVSVLYTFMLQVYDKKGDSDGALKLWTEMQEGNIEPSSQFLQLLSSILKSHKKPIPFVYP